MSRAIDCTIYLIKGFFVCGYLKTLWYKDIQFWTVFHVVNISYCIDIHVNPSIITFYIRLVHVETKPLFKPSLLDPVVLEENKLVKIEVEGDSQVVSAQGTEVEKEGFTTKVPVENEDVYERVSKFVGEEGIGEKKVVEVVSG